MFTLVLKDFMMKKVLSKINTNSEGIELFNTFTIVSLILSLMVMIIILLYFIPVDLLVASDFRTNDYLKSWRVDEGANFTVVYTHSVELTPVSETYTIQDEEIILTETYFKSYGAGLPASTPYKFEITDEGFRIYEINKVIDDLTYRTGAVRANHTLIINDDIYDFLDFSEPREGVKFEVRRLSVLHYFIREGF